MSVLSVVPEDKRKDQRSSLESVYSSSSRLNLLTKRKRMSSIVNMTQPGRGDRYVTQRVLSAKTHRVKQLQNQLADAHYHLQELSNENRALRALQKKQEIALQRYENSNAELPQVLNSHNEEIRIQQSKYKQLRQQLKEVSQRLKERDLHLQQLRDEHQHLLELSKDKNLYEREKLQAQLAEMNTKVQQQNETISLLQRRLTLEAKNFKHQLQAEINKHKDTRNDLDIAINNADKLSTIIEMKEKMLSTAASRGIKSPTKVPSVMNLTRSTAKVSKESSFRVTDNKNDIDNSALGKLCENSRNLSSALSNEEISSSSEPRSRYNTSRTSSSSRATPKPIIKHPKDSDNIIELAKTVQDGMADLTIEDEDLKLRNSSPDNLRKRMEAMKDDLMKKIKNNEEPVSRKSSANLRRKSTEESIEEQIDEEAEVERPKSKGRRNSAVFFDSNSHRAASAIGLGVSNESEKTVVKRENSFVDKKIASKPIDKYCKDIMQDIEKSSKVIDVHMKQFGHSKQVSDKLVEQLQAVDKFNDFVNGKGDMSEETLMELNNNFNILTDRVMEAPVPRKRSISGRRTSRIETTNSILGDANLSNQDLLNDLLGHK